MTGGGDVSASVKSRRGRKEKGRKTEDVKNNWDVGEFNAQEVSNAFLEESSFATLFPKYREKYLREVWNVVTSELGKYGISCELNLVEGSMTVRTTRKTRDPFIILKARDLIRLLARSVPVAQAIKILNDDIFCDIVKIGGLVQNKDRFVKRRQRLIGPKGSTLKAIELLTECYILVQGNTVSCMGNYKGLKNARRIIEECMRNVHPVYNIKALMIKRELAKDDELKNENWERFLPKFKTKNIKKKKRQGKDSDNNNKKKDYTPFPPLPQPSKVDLQLESGEYFMSEDNRRRKKAAQQEVEREQKSKEKRAEKEKAFIPPIENVEPVGVKRIREEQTKGEDVLEIAERVKKKAKKNRKKS